jgi:hypothetical protein
MSLVLCCLVPGFAGLSFCMIHLGIVIWRFWLDGRDGVYCLSAEVEVLRECVFKVKNTARDGQSRCDDSTLYVGGRNAAELHVYLASRHPRVKAISVAYISLTLVESRLPWSVFLPVFSYRWSLC